MTSIHVSASREYDVLVQSGSLDLLGKYAAGCLGTCTAAVISDDIVFPLYGARAIKALSDAGFSVISCTIPHGEQHKTLEYYGKFLNFLCENHMTRSDVVVALGGGVVGDLAGFAAATYQRGVKLVQVPTTLLAMVDSSVGGKTAVDLDSGKNQAGCFYQPSLVVCDPDTLFTLPEEQYRCGCAEIIKYGLLGNAEFYGEIKRRPILEQVEHVITTCVTMKRDIVRCDEFDNGCRQTLNLGHTIGHAVEACSGFSILHGQAVAIGMAAITRAAAAKGICSEKTLREVLEILESYELPTSTDYSLDELCVAAMTDKKLKGETMHIIVPQEIGRCEILEVQAGDMREWMSAGGIA